MIIFGCTRSTREVPYAGAAGRLERGRDSGDTLVEREEKQNINRSRYQY
jgi:hypothetical protein